MIVDSTASPTESMSKRCPTCESIYGDSVDECPQDQTPLENFDPSDDDLIGVVVDDRFRLEGLLGAGGMGRVYRGMQLSVERDVAVKLLRGEAVPDRNMQERFFREARVISDFSHPNIIRLIEFGRDDDLEVPYLVMEMAGGVSLADLTESGRLDPAFAIEVARQVCSGLVEAHNAGIVHRDLKPDNLHLIAKSDGSFLVKILDFGIARPEETDKNLTATGMMCGTAPYVSPEQARADDLDGQADLYSLGVILYEMLTGVRPFQGESGFEVIMQQVKEPPPQITQYLPPNALPEELVHLVYDLLEKDARQRPAGAAAARKRLEDLANLLATDVRVDPNQSGSDQFEPWLLPKGPEGAPIAEADTTGPPGDQSPTANPAPADGPPRDSAPAPGPNSRGTPAGGEPAPASQPPADASGQRAARPEPEPTGQATSTESSMGLGTLIAVAVALVGVVLTMSVGYAAFQYDMLGGGSSNESSGGESSTASAKSGSEEASGSAENSGSDEVDKAWKHRFQKLLDKCRSAHETITQNNKKYSRLIDQGKHDKAEAFLKKMKKQNKQAGKNQTQAAKDISSLIREMQTKGIDAKKIQDMYAKFSKACQDK